MAGTRAGNKVGVSKKNSTKQDTQPKGPHSNEVKNMADRTDFDIIVDDITGRQKFVKKKAAKERREVENVKITAKTKNASSTEAAEIEEVGEKDSDTRRCTTSKPGKRGKKAVVEETPTPESVPKKKTRTKFTNEREGTTWNNVSAMFMERGKVVEFEVENNNSKSEDKAMQAEVDEESEVQFNNSATRILKDMDDWEEEEGEISGVEDLNETSPEEEKECSVPQKEVNEEDQLNKFQELLSSGRYYVDENGEIKLNSTRTEKSRKQRTKASQMDIVKTKDRVKTGKSPDPQSSSFEEDDLSEVTIYKTAVQKDKNRDSSSSDDVDMFEIGQGKNPSPVSPQATSIFQNADLINESIEHLIAVLRKEPPPSRHDRGHHRDESQHRRESRGDKPGTSGYRASPHLEEVRP